MISRPAPDLQRRPAGAGILVILAACVCIGSCDGTLAGPAATSCASPAPILNARDPRVSEIVVRFRSGVDGSSAIARMQSRLHFTVTWEPQDISLFTAVLTDEQIAAVRCDSEVAYLEWDELAMVAILRRKG
jgi:hypothetical protein